jgi:hypothetical protein
MTAGLFRCHERLSRYTTRYSTGLGGGRLGNSQAGLCEGGRLLGSYFVPSHDGDCEW